MSFKYYIDPAHSCVFIKFVGEIDHDEIKTQAVEFIASPDFNVNMNFLRDLTAATLLIGNDLASIKELVATRSAHLDENIGNNRKSAWVLGNVKDFKKIHQFCALSRISHSIIDRQPFRDVNRAIQWLGLPDNYEYAYR